MARSRPKSDVVEHQVKHSDERPTEAGQTAPGMISLRRDMLKFLQDREKLLRSAECVGEERGGKKHPIQAPMPNLFDGRWSPVTGH